MARKVFKQAHRPDEVVFDFEGKDGSITTIHCVDDIPGGVMFDFSGADGKDGAAAIESAKNLFNQAVVPEDRELFWKMLRGADDAPTVITASMMMELAEDLAEAYTERPTGGPSGPGSQKTSNGSPSTGGASQEVQTYSRSQPTGPSIL